MKIRNFNKKLQPSGVLLQIEHFFFRSHFNPPVHQKLYPEPENQASPGKIWATHHSNPSTLRMPQIGAKQVPLRQAQHRRVVPALSQRFKVHFEADSSRISRKNSIERATSENLVSEPADEGEKSE